MVGRQTREQDVVVANRPQAVQDLRERRHNEVVGQRNPATANCNHLTPVSRSRLRHSDPAELCRSHPDGLTTPTKQRPARGAKVIVKIIAVITIKRQ